MKIPVLESTYFEKLKLKKATTERYASYYNILAKQYPCSNFNKKSERMNNCLNFWNWDKYEKNKIMDLQKVNRCKERFCPNCRSVNLSLAIDNFAPKFRDQVNNGFNPFLLTLTSPNVSAENLELEIRKLFVGFTTLWGWFYKDIGKYGFKDRLITFKSAIRTLEVTYNQKTNMYNPHLHCMIFSDGEETEDHMITNIPWIYRNNSQILVNAATVQLSRFWYLAYNKMNISRLSEVPEAFYNDYGHTGLYNVDLTPINGQKGIYEVFKYTFKDSDISNIHVFETITNALQRKRIRQGYGELYNLKLDFELDSKDKTDDIDNYLELKENPETLVTKRIEALLTTYREYKKISRFKSCKHLDLIQ